MKTARFFTIAAAVCTALTAASPIAVCAAEKTTLEFVYEDYTYAVEGIGTRRPYLTVTGFSDTCTEKDILRIKEEIPCSELPAFDGIEQYQTLPVRAIGAHAFTDCKELTSACLPPHIMEIRAGAFENCTRLMDVSFQIDPDYDTKDETLTIGFNSFSGCKNLWKMELPPYTGMIESYAFENCISLEKVYAYATSISSDAFMNCSALEDIYIYNWYTTIDDKAISNEAVQTPDSIVPNQYLFYGTIHCCHNSEAEKFAKEHKYNYAYISALSKDAGDLDKDGAVSVADAQLALTEYTTFSVAGNPSTLDFNQRKNSDINRDGVVTVEDAQLILKYYVQNSVAGTKTSWEDLLYGKPEAYQTESPDASQEQTANTEA